MDSLLGLKGGGRLIIGLAQGLLLYWLVFAAPEKSWLVTNHFVFASLYLTALYVPMVALLGLGRLRPCQLGKWTAAVTVVLVGLALHDVNRRVGVPEEESTIWWDMIRWDMANGPSLNLMIYSAAALFIAHSLVIAASSEGKAIARYPTYFDVAWKQGMQLALGWSFVGLFWLILLLGALMFSMIHLNFFWEIIGKSWFEWPATSLALAAAIHLTDVAPGIIAGIRKVTLTLMSWLLPMLLLIVVGFLVALAVTSLTPLWNTGHGAQLVLIATAVLIFLANAAYQQGPCRPGEDGYLPPRILAWSGMAVGPVSVILVGLAGYATLLRVSEYGWTTNRIILSVIDGVAAVYAIGYTLAGVWNATPRRRWEATNVAASFLIVAVILALLSPIADPTRIAVSSQLARLETGKNPAEKFDFKALRFEGQRYGQEALTHLTNSPNPSIRERATAVLAATDPQEASLPPLPSVDETAHNMVVYPKGNLLPSGLAALEFSKAPIAAIKPDCFSIRGQVCDVVLIGKSGDNADMALIFNHESSGEGIIAKAGADGGWSVVANLPLVCKDVRDALLNGTYSLVPSAIPDIAIGNQRLSPMRPLKVWTGAGSGPENGDCR